MACKSLLDLIATNKREEEKQIILFPLSEAAKATDIQYSLDGFFKESNPYDKPQNNFYGKDPLTVGVEWIDTYFDLNLIQPSTFLLNSVDNDDTSIIDMPSIADVSEQFYLDIIKCNFYANRDYEFIDLEPCPPFKEQEKNYLEYVNRLQNNGNIYDVFAIFTGQKSSDTPIGIVGAEALNAHFERNLEFNAVQSVGELLETDPFRFIQTNNLFRVPYNITVPKSFIGKTAALLEKLSGFYFPFNYLPDDVFGLNRKGSLSQDEQTRILLEYTGKGQKEELQRLLVQNMYKPNIIDNNYTVVGNQYVYVGQNAPDPFNEVFNAEYQIDSSIEEVTDKLGTRQNQQLSLRLFHNSQYNIQSIKKNNYNPDLISSLEDFDYIYDIETTKAIWNKITDNKFDPKSLLYKTKKIVNENSDVSGSFIDSTKREFSMREGDGFIKISKGDGITAFADWQSNDDNLDYVVKKGDFFRAWTKDRKYNKLNRAIYHRGLDRGDKRSVLNDNGLVNIAPTYRASKDQFIKRYMFSIENLAWNDNIADLPECEIGQGDLLTGHRGRIMWFPPYDLSFSENSSPNWNEHNFIGRGEPIFSYNNTKRSGTISFTMIVDHPAIVNKIRGERIEIWERYFKGDKSVESYINNFKRRVLNQKEIEELEKVRKYNNSPSKTTNEQVLTPTQKKDIIIEKNATNSDNSTGLKFVNVYFPNNVSALPTLKGGESNNQGYQSKFQVEGLDYTYYKGKKRDLQHEKKTGQIAYPNRTNYEFNNDFFTPEYIKAQFDKVFSELEQKQATTILFSFIGYASQADPVDTSNAVLSENRASVVKKWFDDELNKYKITNNIGDVLIDTSFVVGASDARSPNTGDDVDRDARSAVEARRVEIKYEFDNSSVDTTPSSEQNVNDISASDNLNQNINLLPSSSVSLDNLSPDLIEKLLGISECDMFEYLEVYDPFLHKTISEKIKYFVPGFHSMTPEGFNGRLNFLQQCTRQGQSIGIDGIDNLTNFAFGRPPVCILKIGDFFHTKIIIESLSIDYEKPKWDLNPQGFVAPMIAKINLNINILGGQSISAPINRLQNALSYNFYASMEMFDPRADSIAIIEKNNGESDVQIADGIKLSKIISPEALTERKEKIVNDIKSEYGNVLPVQKINPVTSVLFDNVPSEISSASDIIQLKRALNLPLTQAEKNNIQ